MHVVDNKDSNSFQLHPTSSAFAMGFRLSELNMYEASVKRDYLRTHLAVSIKLFDYTCSRKKVDIQNRGTSFCCICLGVKTFIQLQRNKYQIFFCICVCNTSLGVNFDSYMLTYCSFIPYCLVRDLFN